MSTISFVNAGLVPSQDLSCDGSDLNGPNVNLDLSDILKESGIRQPNIVHTRVAGIYGHDNREFANITLYPYTTIGKLTVTFELRNSMGELVMESDSTCTASLVGNCQLLSASHCLKPPEEGFVVKRMVFTDSQGREHISNLARRSNWSDVNNDDNDAAFLHLETSPGRELGYMGVMEADNRTFRDNQSLEVAGFSGDILKGEFLTVDREAVNVRRDFLRRNRLSLRADTYQGDSGGPVIYYDNANIPYIVGVNSNGVFDIVNDRVIQRNLSNDERSQLANATSTGAFFDSLDTFIANNTCNE